MTGTARRGKVTEGASGQVMENLGHLFGIYCEWMGHHWMRVLSRRERQADLTFKMTTLGTLLRIF